MIKRTINQQTVTMTMTTNSNETADQNEVKMVIHLIHSEQWSMLALRICNGSLPYKFSEQALKEQKFTRIFL